MLNFRGRRAPIPGLSDILYDMAVAGSRQTRLYAELGAPDTVEGRFELLTAYVILIIESLNRAGGRGRGLAQSVFDIYLRNLDGALREMGVGDLAVGKRMKNLGRIFYGRALAYEKAFASGDPAELSALVGRTILMDEPEADAAALSEYLRLERDRLIATAISELGLEPVA